MTHRTRIFESPLAVVENLRCRGLRQVRSPEGFSAQFRICLPYRGFFIWHVGADDVVGDANQALFVSGGEAYRVSEPLSGGYAELIVTPNLELLCDLVQTSESRLRLHPLFVLRSRRAPPELQMLRARLLHAAANDGLGGLADDLVVALLRTALGAEMPPVRLGCSTKALIHRTKEFVEAHLSESLRLSDVARAVGASPAYVTNVFRRVEGVPLHKYVVQSRLARSLLGLPHANDLTRLALDVGFSSHSHFAAAFRRAFGCTPSEFRASTRQAQQKRIA